jgi:hypothetical protein
VGTLVGCLRKLQQWNLASILDEYRSFSAPSPRLLCEQLIELWDPDLVQIPEGSQPPHWYEAQLQMQEEDAAVWLRWRLGPVGTPRAGVEGGVDWCRPVLQRGRSGEAEHSEAGGVRDITERGEELRQYFRVSGELASTGTVTTLVLQDDVVGD